MLLYFAAEATRRRILLGGTSVDAANLARDGTWRATIAPMRVTDEQIRDAIAGLLASRQPAATICPSEAARALAPGDWRPLMAQVRTVAISMATEGLLDIRQGGRTVRPDGPLRGPIRLGRTTRGATSSSTLK